MVLTIGWEGKVPIEKATSRNYALIALFCATVGIFAFRMTAWTLFRGPLSLILSDSYVLSHGAQLVTIIVLMALSALISLERRAQGALVIAAALVMAISAGLVMYVPQARFQMEFVDVACAVHGAASAIVFMGWGVFTCSQRPREAAGCIVAAFLLYGIATGLLTAAPAFVPAVSLIAPLASGALLIACFRLVSSKQDAERASSHRPLRALLGQLPWGLIAFLAICSLMVTISSVLVPAETLPQQFSTNTLWVPIFLIILTVVVFSFILKRRESTQELWVLFSFIMFCGLIAFSSLSLVDYALAIGFMRASQECLFMFSWILAADIIYRFHLPVIPSFGLAAMLLMMPEPVPAALLKCLLGGVPLSAQGPLSTLIALLMCVALVAFTFVLLYRQIREQREKGEAAVSQDTALEDRVSTLEESLGLTSREREVTMLLLQGYSMPQISERLFISLDTVRTHMRHIYQKAGVHSKVELIELSKGNRTSQ